MNANNLHYSVTKINQILLITIINQGAVNTQGRVVGILTEAKNGDKGWVLWKMPSKDGSRRAKFH